MGSRSRTGEKIHHDIAGLGNLLYYLAQKGCWLGKAKHVRSEQSSDFLGSVGSMNAVDDCPEGDEISLHVLAKLLLTRPSVIFVGKQHAPICNQLIHFLWRIAPARGWVRRELAASARLDEILMKVRALGARCQTKKTSTHPWPARIVVWVRKFRFVARYTAYSEANISRICQNILMISRNIRCGASISKLTSFPDKVGNKIFLAIYLVQRTAQICHFGIIT